MEAATRQLSPAAPETKGTEGRPLRWLSGPPVLGDGGKDFGRCLFCLFVSELVCRIRSYTYEKKMEAIERG